MEHLGLDVWKCLLILFSGEVVFFCLNVGTCFVFNGFVSSTAMGKEPFGKI